MLLGAKWVFKICKCLVLNSTNISNFQPLEVVCHGRQTQLQVGEMFFFNVAFEKNVKRGLF